MQSVAAASAGSASVNASSSSSLFGDNSTNSIATYTTPSITTTTNNTDQITQQLLGNTNQQQPNLQNYLPDPIYLLWSTKSNALNDTLEALLSNSTQLLYSLLQGAVVEAEEISNNSTTFHHHQHYHYLPNGTSSVAAALLLSTEAAEVTAAANTLQVVALEADGSYRNSSLLEGERQRELEELLGPSRDSTPTVVLMTVVYALILLIGVSGNLLTCLVIAKQRYMHTATNFYLFSLAVSDFLFLILGIPNEIVLLWQRYPYIFNEAFCILRGFVSELCTNCSILIIVGFTIERYVAICHPLLSHTTLKLSRVVKVIALTWIIATLSAIPIAWQFGLKLAYDSEGEPYPHSEHCTIKRELYPYLFEIATMVFFVVPIILISVLYILIGLKLRASSRSSTGVRRPSSKRVNETASTKKSKSKGSKSSSSVLKSGGGGQYSSSDGKNNNYSSSGSGNGSRPLSMSIRRQNNSRRAVIKMLVAVVIAFFFCYSPFHAQRVMAAVFGRLDPNVQVTKQVEQLFNFFTHISGITYYLSACLNPVLYQVFSKKFQLALKETLPCCRKWARRGEHDEMNASTVLPANTGSGSGGGGGRPIVGYGHHHQHLHTPTGMGAGGGRRPIPPASASATNQSS
ncbi:G-protein coupled receptor 1, partial [Tyrophagus putrescentiae]